MFKWLLTTLLLDLCIILIVSKKKINKAKQSINIAFCLTGQLARLELLSKIHNIMVPNAKGIVFSIYD